MNLVTATLPRYFIKRYLFNFSINFLGIVIVVFLVDMNETIRRLADLPGYTIGLGAAISILRVPNIIQIAIPFVVLIATMATLMGLNQKYELVVSRASGFSAWQFLTSIIATNIMIGAMVTLIMNPLGAAAAAYADRLAAEAGLPTLSISTQDVPPWLKQTTDEGATIIGSQSSFINGRTLTNVTFVRFDNDNKIMQRLEAQSAHLNEGEWLLEDVRVFEDGRQARAESQVSVKTNLRPEFVEETFASPDTVSFFELPNKIRAANSFGLNANAYAMKLHQLIALPFLLAAMTLIAAMVSLDFVRFGQSISTILGGILSGFLLYVVTELISAFGIAGAIPPFVAAWIPVIVASALGATVLLHKEDG